MLGKGTRRVKRGARTLVLGTVVLASALALAAPPAGEAARRERIAALYAEARSRFPGVAEVTAEEVLAHPDRYLLVDVRRADERAVSALPGAVDRQSLEEDPGRVRGRVVVAYCTIGHRSGHFARERNEAGHPTANLAGGILAWVHAGGEVIREGEEVDEVHVYGPRWNLLPQSHRAIW